MKKKDFLAQRRQLEELARETMGQSTILPLREPGYLYHHGLRVARLSLQLAKMVGEKSVNLHYLYAAGLFHDVAKGQEQHALAGADRMPELLHGICTTAEISEIARLVAGHNARSLPNRHRKDVRLLQDADILDHFGAQGLWLGIYFSARSSRTQPQMLAYYRGEEYLSYVSRCERTLNFDAAKKEFRQRLRSQQAILKKLELDLPATGC